MRSGAEGDSLERDFKVVKPFFQFLSESATYEDFKIKAENYITTLDKGSKDIVDGYMNMFEEEAFNEAKKQTEMMLNIGSDDPKKVLDGMAALDSFYREGSEKSSTRAETVSTMTNEALVILEQQGIQTVEEIEKKMESPGYALGAYKAHVLKLLKRVNVEDLNPDEKTVYDKSLIFFENFEMSSDNWKKFKEVFKKGKERIDGAKERANGRKESIESNITYSQQFVLRDIAVDISKLNKGKEGDAGRKEAFVSSLARQIYPRLNKIAKAQRKRAQRKNLRDGAAAQRLSDATATDHADNALFTSAQSAMGGYNTLLDLGSMFDSDANLSSDPLLMEIFPTEAARKIFSDLALDKNSSPEQVMELLKKGLSEKIFKGDISSLLDDLDSNKYSGYISFMRIQDDLENASNPEDLQSAEEKAQAVADLLDTMPEAYHKSTWGNKYESYVLKKGSMSMDFDEWIDTQNISPLMKLYYTLIKPIMDFFQNMGEDPEKLEENLQSKKYRDLLAEEQSVEPDDGKPREPSKPRPRGEVLGEQRALTTAFSKAAGKDVSVDAINFTVDGKPLTESRLETNSEEFSEIVVLLNAQPESYQLLTKGLPLEDLKFLAKRRGDVSDDGINVEFDKTGFDISVEWGALEGRWSDELAGFTAGMVSGGAVGAGIGTLSFVPILGTLSGAVLGAIGGGIAGIGIDTGGDNKLLYSESNPENVAESIRKVKKLIGELDEVVRDVKTKLEGFSKEEQAELKDAIPKLEKSEAFKGFYEKLTPSLWNNYPLTVSDMKNFAKAEEKGLFDSDEDTFHAEDEDFYSNFGNDVIGEYGVAEEVDVDNGKKYLEVDGSHLFQDYKFENAKSFFAWLAKQEL